MAVKLYQLFCSCGWKRITDGSDIGDLYEIKLSPVPKGLPKFDKQKKKTIVSEPRERIRKFRCPECGHAVKPKKIEDHQALINQKLEQEYLMEQQRLEIEMERGRIAEIQEKDLEHDRKAEEERRKQRKIEAEMRLKKYEKKD